jgi:ubiquinone/menaquinone biosynthesis C-methylase UbiE
VRPASTGSRYRTAASAGGSSTTASAHDGFGRLYARLAFGPLAAVYDLLTSHDSWVRDAAALAALVTGPRVLDLGVGPGPAALAMAQAEPALRIVGMDRSAAMCRRAATRARGAGVALPLVRGDALQLPFRSGTLDGATGHSVLYLLPDPAAALAEIFRALRPGGRVAFLEPREAPGALRIAARAGPRHAAAMTLWRGMSRLHRRFDGDDLAALLDRAGFAEARAFPVLDGFGVVATATRG